METTMFEDKTVAESINELMLNLSRDLDHSVKLVKEKGNEEEFIKYRRSVGKILAEIFESVLVPIYTKYPELDINGIFKNRNES